MIKAIVVSVFVYVAWCALAILVLPLVVISLLLPRRIRYRNQFFYGLMALFSRVLLAVLPVKIIVRGVIPNDVPLVVIANHASMLDPLIIESVSGATPRVWLFKDMFRSLPIIGWLLSRVAIPVARESPHKAAQALVSGLHLVARYNAHLMLFPEGKRFADGTTHQFKSGFARAAFRLGRAVLPILLINSRSVFPTMLVRHAEEPIQVIIGEPLVPASRETEAAFVDRVHAWYLNSSGAQRTRV